MNKVKAITFLFLILSISLSLSIAPAQAEDDKIVQEMSEVIKTQGIDGLRVYLRENIDRISVDLIVWWAYQAMEARNEAILLLMLETAQEKKDDKCLADVLFIVGNYYYSSVISSLIIF